MENVNENSAEETLDSVAEGTEKNAEGTEVEVSGKMTEQLVGEVAGQQIKLAESAEEVTEESEEEVAAQSEEETSEETKALSPEEKKEALVKKIKIGCVIAGGVFILLAAVYAAAVMGGRNLEIKDEEPPVVIVEEEPEITPEPTTIPTIEVIPEIVEEEDRAEDSLINLVQGNARYDDCVYADGGIVIVKSKDMYGAIDYEGNEIVKPAYDTVIQKPTEEGRFVLANSKVESKTEEHAGTTYTYDAKITTYTLFDNTGKKVYEGNNEILASKDVYVLAIEDEEDIRKNRVEYYKFADTKKAFLTLYVTDQFSLNGFNKEGKTVVMGYSAPPTEDQDTNPTNLNCGIMDENGKVKWFAKAPGMDEFNAEVKKWKEENKVAKKEKNKKKKTVKAEDTENDEELDEAEETEKKYDEDGNEIIDDEEAETVDDEETTEDDDEVEAIEDTTDSEEDETDTAAGPTYHMNEVLSAPSEGFFIYKDLYDVEDSYSIYADNGVWYADLDTGYMTPDAKNGFVLGNFNNGAVDVKRFIYNGESYWNVGSNMVLTVGDKDVLIDVSKAKGMTNDSLTDKIVVAVYDSISISDANYWPYKDGKTSGYLDRKGKALKLTYSDVTDFVNGYALVVKDGKAIIIDEEFNEIEEISEATGVDIAGDMFIVYREGGVRRYMFKTTRENPTGEEKSDDKEDSKATPEVTPAEKKSKKNK